MATACTAAPAATLRATSSKRHAFTAAVQLRSGECAGGLSAGMGRERGSGSASRSSARES